MSAQRAAKAMIRGTLVLGMTGGLLAACASGPDPQVAQRAQTAMLGMPKAKLLSCAGVPDRQATANGREYYTYVASPSGAVNPNASVGIGGFGGNFSGGSGGGVGLGIGVPLVASGAGGCEATFVLGNGVVEQVSYPSGASLSSCTTIVQNCMAQPPQ